MKKFYAIEPAKEYTNILSREKRAANSLSVLPDPLRPPQDSPLQRFASNIRSDRSLSRESV